MALARRRGNYVLVAMPNLSRAEQYRAAIAATPYETLVVRDGEEAQRKIASAGTPALLILDLSLPKVDGFELLKELRQQTPPGETATIVVSGHASIRAAARRLAETLGISRVLPFDVDRPALREAIDATLNELNPNRHPASPDTVIVPGQSLEPAPAGALVIDAAVLAVARRFPLAVTVAYVKIGQREHVRGYFAYEDPTETVGAAPSISFLRQLAAGSEPLIIPNVTNHPAQAEVAPEGMPLIRGFAATPFAAQGEIRGALCVMDTNPLQMDANELDALEALGRDLGRDLAAPESDARALPEATAAAPSVDTDSLERLASADPLTGLNNRRGGERDIAAEISRARRQGTPLSCVLLDIDHFKRVNDTFGHQAGDYVLREIGAILRQTVRAYDILVRWGGEEFLVVLPGVEQDQAFKLGERIRQAVENMPLPGIGGVTASVGVAPLGADFSFEGMFAAADRRLYAAKASGRNTVA